MLGKVVIAEEIAEAGLELLRRSCEVELAAGADRAELIGLLFSARGLVVRSATDVDAELIEAAPDLVVIARAGSGIDNIDLQAAQAAGVLVVNTPDANVVSAAEHTMALLLALARNIPSADRALRTGAWDRGKFKGVELDGKTLGVIGLGRVGSLVAERARAFGMKVMAFDPYISAERARLLAVDLTEDMKGVLSTADFITLHLPLTEETAGLIGTEEISSMVQGVRIVNTSRGGILVEDDLAQALRTGHVAGAALDVFDTEPPTESPLLEFDQVVLTPHLGASTEEAQERAGVAAVEAVLQALQGHVPRFVVTPDGSGTTGQRLVAEGSMNEGRGTTH